MIRTARDITTYQKLGRPVIASRSSIVENGIGRQSAVGSIIISSNDDDFRLSKVLESLAGLCLTDLVDEVDCILDRVESDLDMIKKNQSTDKKNNESHSLIRPKITESQIG